MKNQLCCFLFLCFALVGQKISAAGLGTKKILFVMDRMNVGGTERSLINLINAFPKKDVKICVYLLQRGGLFEKFLLENPDVSIIDRRTVFLNSYDVVVSYASWIRPDIWVNTIHAKKRIQWIHTDATVDHLRSRLFKEKKLWQKIDTFVCVSDTAQVNMGTTYPKISKKLCAIYSLFDTSLIRKEAEEAPVGMEVGDGILNIVTVARLSPEKCLDTAILVHKKLEKAGIPVRWYVVGEGVERQRLQELIRSSGLQGKFILLGQKPNPYPYIKNGDIFALLSSSEGFGMVITEAKALRRPILVTSFPASQEQIQQGVNGLIVDHDIDSIYKGLRRLILDKKLRDTYPKALENFAYDNSKSLQKIHKLFLE